MNADHDLMQAVYEAYLEVTPGTRKDHEKEIERLKDLIGSYYPDLDLLHECDGCAHLIDCDDVPPDGPFYCDDCAPLYRCPYCHAIPPDTRDSWDTGCPTCLEDIEE